MSWFDSELGVSTEVQLVDLKLPETGEKRVTLPLTPQGEVELGLEWSHTMALTVDIPAEFRKLLSPLPDELKVSPPSEQALEAMAAALVGVESSS